MHLTKTMRLLSQINIRILFFLLFINGIVAWSSGDSRTGSTIATVTRKDILRTIWGVAVGAAALSSPTPILAEPYKAVPKYQIVLGSEEKPLSKCVPGKQNCWSTVDSSMGRHMEPWVPPPSLAKEGSEAIVHELEDTIAKYPQSGQGGVDGGGWVLAQKGEKDGVIYMRYEFTSEKFKYVDDLEIRIDSNGVSTRSASRTGGFDYGVNASRLNYITSGLNDKGWQVKMI
uniref:Uncharacterized protein n=1 Tax=Attheya septentrionalis TaxID=420275 RepID=A0A7S2U7Q1_9STRA|mmetsp:Transcript_11501/g.20954  ORF Transcript_11501/g.20954 Transcript_11501/m.20954 type:complete len:230 (+) Transcript_11501:120-809(+)